MEYILHVYKDGKYYKEVSLKKTAGGYIYKWEKVDSGNYSFILFHDNKEYGITYNHTAPFASEFEAYASETEHSKPISGFQQGIDILIEYKEMDNKFKLFKQSFTRVRLDLSEYDIDKAEKLEIAGSFNKWTPEEEPVKHIDENIYELVLSLDEGYYEYKIVADDVWYPKTNITLIIGENGVLFPEGKKGNGEFSYDAKDKSVELKAIKHNIEDLMYFNRISNKTFEFSIRTQFDDIERVFISVIPTYVGGEQSIEFVEELERFQDYTNNFDYFKRRIKFPEKIEKISYIFILKDGNNTVYFNGNALIDNDEERIVIDKDSNTTTFHIPDWSKEAIWYNIFPDRYYNANMYNDPIFNEMGPESFVVNNLHENKFIQNYKWNKMNRNLGKFDRNRWTSDFSERTTWEKVGEQGLDYSLKYARMYGGDIEGIKAKIPYMKELGINAVWLNPVFYSYQNHKYGANDFRHISPDLGTIRTSGDTHDVYIDENNKYGNKSYVEVLGVDAVNNSELKLLDVNLVGEHCGINGYMESEDPSTWVWTESDLIMVSLIKEFHKNGIRVIFDGVFNHSSERHWSFDIAMMEGAESKYAKWYKFNDFSRHTPITSDMSEEEAYEILLKNRQNVEYNGWAGIKTLPEFNTYNTEWKEYIFNITRKWMLGPDGVASDDWQEDDGIDGFRLDVPNCLENQVFWNEWRTVVKEAKYDSYITAELWGNAQNDINKGNKYDAVMNYEWLKTTIGYFINQSKEGGDRYKLSAEDFFNELREKRSWYPYQVIQGLQNLNGSHDTDRLYSRIVNDCVGRNLEEGKQLEKGYNSIRPDMASNYHPNTTIDWVNIKKKPKDILKLISVFQMTYIGAPMIYYGDEVGMWGATDPLCRKPMLWDEYSYDDEKNPSYINRGEKYEQKQDKELLEWYKKIIWIRRNHDVLVHGNFKEIYFDNTRDVIAYERYDKKMSIITIINNSFDDNNDILIKTYHKNVEFIDLITGKKIRTKSEGEMNINLKAKKAMILRRIK